LPARSTRSLLKAAIGFIFSDQHPLQMSALVPIKPAESALLNQPPAQGCGISSFRGLADFSQVISLFVCVLFLYAVTILCGDNIDLYVIISNVSYSLGYYTASKQFTSSLQRIARPRSRIQMASSSISCEPRSPVPHHPSGAPCRTQHQRERSPHRYWRSDEFVRKTGGLAGGTRR